MQTRGGDNSTVKEDTALIGRMAGGDPVALRSFYQLHSPIVFALCLRILGDSHEAEDVLVDIFYEFWRRAGTYDASRGSPMGMLMSLTRSRAIDRKRAKRKLPTVSIENSNATDLNAIGRPDVQVSSLEQGRSIREALSSLLPQQRQAIECAYYDGMSHSEIADAMDKPLGTVKTYIRQGLMRMRDGLKSMKQDMA